MNLFIQELEKRDLQYILGMNQFIPIAPRNSDKFATMVQHIVENNLRVYIDPDCDPDGYFSARIIKGMFDRIGYTNYGVGRHDHKRHKLRQAYIGSLIDQGYQAFIIVDSSTNDLPVFEYIVSRGCLVACIDHHTPHYTFEDYPKGTVIINPLMESSTTKITYNKLSAGALCALVASYTLKVRYNITNVIELYMYGVVTLYSDSCDLSNPYNIAFIRTFQNQQIFNSDIISLFMNQYSHFDRSFISFNMIPRLNALMRMEKFDILYQLFFEPETIQDREAFKAAIEEIYRECKKYTKSLMDSCSIDQHKNFVVATLPKDVSPVARNFTGLVANALADQYNQTCMCLFHTDALTFGGSVRDPFSRNMLNVFSPLMHAEGHSAAFGISLRKEQLGDICKILDQLDDIFVQRQNDLIVIPWDNRPPAEIRAEMQLMSEYNEFSGMSIPKAVGILTIQKNWKIYPAESYTKVYGNGQKFTCFVKSVMAGDVMIITPTSNGSDYQLIVNNVKYN